ncbi:hypothetical protein Cus16_1491 [Curtobacterium sp. ER1/6]|nr:hypothetical protein Cus16_1491 [Curtobacterium sp. ER1/6]
MSWAHDTGPAATGGVGARSARRGATITVSARGLRGTGDRLQGCSFRRGPP